MTAIINQTLQSRHKKGQFYQDTWTTPGLLLLLLHKRTNLENCPRIAGIEPLYNPLAPSSGSFDMICGKVSVDACTCVWWTSQNFQNTHFHSNELLFNFRINFTISKTSDGRNTLDHQNYATTIDWFISLNQSFLCFIENIKQENIIWKV